MLPLQGFYTKGLHRSYPWVILTLTSSSLYLYRWLLLLVPRRFVSFLSVSMAGIGNAAITGITIDVNDLLVIIAINMSPVLSRLV